MPRKPKPRRGRGRPQLPDVFLALVARDYALAIRRGDPPLQFVATMRRATVAKARNWVALARRRGFLTRTTMGARGGATTAKARRVLETWEGS